MASNPPVAVYDACVLYPFHLRNVLVQCAFDGLVEARWTDDIYKMSGFRRFCSMTAIGLGGPNGTIAKQQPSRLDAFQKPQDQRRDLVWPFLLKPVTGVWDDV